MGAPLSIFEFGIAATASSSVLDCGCCPFGKLLFSPVFDGANLERDLLEVFDLERLMAHILCNLVNLQTELLPRFALLLSLPIDRKSPFRLRVGFDALLRYAHRQPCLGISELVCF